MWSVTGCDIMHAYILYKSVMCIYVKLKLWFVDGMSDILWKIVFASIHGSHS